MRSYSDLVREVKATDDYWVTSAKMDFAMELNSWMKKENVNKATLAKKISKSAAYISKVLKGDSNFTIETMVKLTRAIGCRLHIHIGHQSASTRWFDLMESKVQKVPLPNWNRAISNAREYSDGQKSVAA